MHSLRSGGPRHAAVSMAAPALLLQGCAEAPAAGASWLFISLALVVGAIVSYALGRAHAARVGGADLRQARAEARLWRNPEGAWHWRSDASHRLQLWQAPGASHSPGAAAEGASLAELFFGSDGTRTLPALLGAECGFSALRVACSDAAGLGGRHWVLSASPCFDDAGRFVGHVGHARPTDAEDAAQLAAAALEPLLATCAAAVATHQAGGWTLQIVAAAARRASPLAAPGAALATALPALPPALVAALDGLQPGQPFEAEGWRVQALALQGDARGLLLQWPEPAPAAVAAPAGTAGTAETAEGETFSFTVSHDLRAPIRVVEGFTRIVKEDYGRLLDRVGNDHLDRVLGAAARMNLMIDALLTLARLSAQPLAQQPVDLSQLAGYVMDDLRRGAPERRADIHIEPGLTAQGDPTLLRLVLENLLGNAWKYTARCATAEIALQRIAQRNGPAFEVADNGAGFDMRSAERLFGLFQRLHSANDFPGHGVGLASVKRIVQRHGGEIWAESEPGRGATFRFTLAP